MVTPTKNNNKYFVRIYGDCLSKKIIVDVFCSHIDKDAALMKTAVVTFRNSGIAGLRKCVNEELQRRKQAT